MPPRSRPRRKSLNIPGHAHELTFTCYRRFKFLNSDQTRHWLAAAINGAAQAHNYAVWAYVFMPEHVHLLVLRFSSFDGCHDLARRASRAVRLRLHDLTSLRSAQVVAPIIHRIIRNGALVHPQHPDYDISRFLAAIKEPVGRRAIKYIETYAPHWLPHVTRQRGGRIERLFWQSGGGYDRNLYKPRGIVDSVNYLHHNPVRRQLVTRPMDWPWSSAAWHATRTPGPVHIDPIPTL